MSDAEAIATRLAYEFFRMGRYSASTGPMEIVDLEARAASTDYEVDLFTDRVEAFSGLQIQSVGFEDGVDDQGVHIYLTRGTASVMKSLPSSIDDVPIRIHKMGPISVKPESAGAHTNRGNIFIRNGRICCGTSCGPTSERGAGTIGAIVTFNNQRDLYLLSNNHVLAGCNHVPLNQPILAPSNMDGRPDAPAPREVGRHHSIGILRSGDPQFVDPCDADVALAQVTDPDEVSSWQGESDWGFDTPNQIMNPRARMKVKKVGRTTGLTVGSVEARVNTPMPVTYQSKHFKGVVWFKDVWTVRAGLGSNYFALPGDSGSLVVTEDHSASVGVVFAANRSGEYAWMVSLPTAIAALNGISLVSNHGV